MPASYADVPIRIVHPSSNLSEIGVDYLKVTEDGLARAYEQGRRAGESFMAEADG